MLYRLRQSYSLSLDRLDCGISYKYNAFICHLYVCVTTVTSGPSGLMKISLSSKPVNNRTLYGKSYLEI